MAPIQENPNRIGETNASLRLTARWRSRVRL